MAQYCAQCGSEKEDNGQTLCQECLSSAEQAADAAAAEPAQGAALTASAAPQDQGRQAADKIMPYIELVRKLILNPLETLRSSLHNANALPGTVIAVSSAIIMSLIGLLFIRGILSLLFGFVGGYSALLYGGLAPIPYGEIFIRMLLLFVLQWVVLSLVLSGMGRLFSIRVSVVQALNLIGFTKVYVAVTWVVACILFYIYEPLAIAALLGGAVIGYLAIDRTLNAADTSAKPLQFYFVPAVLAVYLIAIAIVMRIVV